ncbi:hypothetical protein LV79_001618 [Actinokineospora globicatena]|nr:hypothetical protein [Actinokineospora globicatena]
MDAVGHGLLDNVTIAAPRFVRPLLEIGGAHRGEIRISPSPVDYVGADGAEALAEIVTQWARDVPVVVFTPVPRGFVMSEIGGFDAIVEQHRSCVERAATMCMGLAQVCTLDSAGVSAFDAIVGETYGVRDGAFRIYLPEVDPATDLAWRHRYSPLNRYLRTYASAGRMINRSIGFRAGARMAPKSYDLVSRLLTGSTSSEFEELLDIADEENQALRSMAQTLDQRYQDLIDEVQQLESDNNRLRADLVVAKKQLGLAGAVLWTGHAEEMTAAESLRLPEGADSPSDAFRQAREYLGEFLSIPDGVGVELDNLDASVESRAWGATAWRAFVSLYSYGQAMAVDPDVGSFWTWCETSGNPHVWTASPKKLAMKESASVNRSEKLRAKRYFPVDPAVDASGKRYMEAHIKIAEGGGPLAPRIYFCAVHDPAKVHVGYFGPHSKVPNTLN